MIETKSDMEMRAFGEQLGRLLKGGEVIELVGDVGAGKTTLVRGLAQGMGVTETVQSPSFTISRVYDADDGRRLVHYDFYRLSDAGIMADELADTLHDNTSVVVVEWAAAVEQVLPTDRLTITITSPGETLRHLELRSGGTDSRAVEEKLQ
jgi:tRNA threonylcarbamoyladenosine biosynthesis protein TsaE